jgi:adenine deaminase
VDVHEGNHQVGKSKERFDALGSYVIPGLIDPHVHIESSMLTPRQFAKAVLTHGTTTVVTDPHEIANVYGIKGVQYMIESGLDTPLRQLIHVPSCVPSVLGLENNGASFGPDEIETLFKMKNVVGLAEVMDFVGVIHNEERIHELLDIAHKNQRFIQGHAPSLMGNERSAYRLGGPLSDHEITMPQEAIEALRVGIYVDARDSSIAQNITEIYQGVKNLRYLDRLTLCTDDREAQDILNSGSVDSLINLIIKEGMDPIDAIRCGTLNAATQIGEPALGAIAPGCVADLVFTDSLKLIKATKVFVSGKLVAQDGLLITEMDEKTYPLEKQNSIHLPLLTLDDLTIKTPILNGEVTVNVLAYEGPNSVVTFLHKEVMKVKEGHLCLDDPQLKIVAVINRYGLSNIALHVVRDFGTIKGCVASTVSHDSHNLILVYDDPEDALVACLHLKETQGGMCTVLDQKVTGSLELPVGGLMANIPIHEMAHKAELLKERLRELGLNKMENPLLRIVTLALPVIPYVKMSDRGCIDVVKKTFIPLYD